MRLQHLRKQHRQVKPFPRRSLERSVVQIEPVYVEERAHRQPLQKAGASEEAPRPAVETARGVAVNPGAPEPAIKPAVCGGSIPRGGAPEADALAANSSVGCRARWRPIHRRYRRDKGQWSIRINDQWRICFEWPEGSPGPSNVEIVDYH